MPRKTKNDEVLEEKKVIKKAAKNVEKNVEDAPKIKATSKKATSSKTTKPKESKASPKVKEEKKTLAEKKTTTSKKKVATSKVAKTTTKIIKTSKSTSSTKVPKDTKKKTTRKKTTATKIKKDVLKNKLEYYDLPYRYNQTVIKLLYQTPTALFVYWDISDEDKQNYINQYGEYFFYNTKPVLVIHNETMNYSFEVDINDYANSWYIHVNDSNCKYKLELGRRPINQYVEIPNNYLYVTSSNEIEAPNDHILFDKNQKTVFFKNVKTNQVNTKDIASLSFMKNMGKIYNIYDLYKEIYKDEILDDNMDLSNPSSSNPTSTFK